MRTTARLVLATALVLLVADCQSQDNGRAVPAGPAVRDVTMDEYRFHYEGAIPAGRVVFRVRNAGRLNHRLTLLPVAEDVPPIDVQLKGSQRRFVRQFAGVPDRRPGTTGTFAVDLAPAQRYAMICFVVDADGQTHARKGMALEFRPSLPGPVPSITPATNAPTAGSDPAGDDSP